MGNNYFGYCQPPGLAQVNNNKLGLSWGSTRLRQLAWSYPSKLNIVFITVFNIGLNIKLHIWLNIGFNIVFNIVAQNWVQYWVQYLVPILGSI